MCLVCGTAQGGPEEDNKDENNVSNQRLKIITTKKSQGNWSRLLRGVKIITLKYAKG